MLHREEFKSIIERIKKTGVSKKLLNSKSVEDVRKAINEFEDENNDILFAISDWDKEYYPQEYGNMITHNDDIDNPIEVVLFIYYLPSSTEDDIIEDERDLINALNAFDSKIVKAVAKFINHNYIYLITLSDIAKYM